MKITLTLATLFAAFNMYAQLSTFSGIFPLDECDFSDTCEYVEIPNPPSNMWVRGDSQKSILTSTGGVMITDSVNSYPNETNASFEVHWPAWNQYPLSLIMSFHHSMDSDSLLDGGIIEVSRDYGATWTNVIEDQSNMLFLSNELYTSSDTLFTGEKGFSGTFVDRYTEIEWVWMFPIKEFPTDTMHYRFRFISDTINNQKEGWMISDIAFSYADLGTGLEERVLFDFSIAPNPSNGLIEVSSPSEVEKAILRDLNGNTVQVELLGNKKVLNYSGLSKGIYFLQLQTSDDRLSQVKRLIID
ncbi:MAG: hypothetical protein RLZZ585_1738 [Bacteroidota bacterium]|jgi:hypothetical protein